MCMRVGKLDVSRRGGQEFRIDVGSQSGPTLDCRVWLCIHTRSWEGWVGSYLPYGQEGEGGSCHPKLARLSHLCSIMFLLPDSTIVIMEVVISSWKCFLNVLSSCYWVNCGHGRCSMA